MMDLAFAIAMSGVAEVFRVRYCQIYVGEVDPQNPIWWWCLVVRTCPDELVLGVYHPHDYGA